MTKSLLAIATAIFALGTMFASTAEAGFKVRLGFGGPVPFHHFSNDYQPKTYRKHSYRKVRRHRAARKYYAAKTPTKQQVETTETAEAPEATRENSSIATAGAKTVQTAEAPAKSETVQTASVETPKELGCKKFFPSVGMVLSVPCE